MIHLVTLHDFLERHHLCAVVRLRRVGSTVGLKDWGVRYGSGLGCAGGKDGQQDSAPRKEHVSSRRSARNAPLSHSHTHVLLQEIQHASDRRSRRIRSGKNNKKTTKKQTKKHSSCRPRAFRSMHGVKRPKPGERDEAKEAVMCARARRGAWRWRARPPHSRMCLHFAHSCAPACAVVVVPALTPRAAVSAGKTRGCGQV